MSAFDQQFQTGPLAVHRHERRGGGSLSTRLIRLNSPAHAVVDPPTDELVVGLMVAGSAGARWAWDGGRANVTAARHPGTLGLTPIGAAGTFEVDGASTILIVSLPYPALTARLELDLAVPRDFGRLHDAYQDRPEARALCQRLWRAAGRPGFARDETIDALSEALLASLAGETPVETVQSLSAQERRRVQARAERPDADVAALAEAAAMPVRSFRRRFQAAFGEPPHRWLASRRIARARHLLQENRLSLSETALDLGFASQAHFTEAFRRAVGVTPGRFRRDVRG